ncbi:hypothetical protein [Shouchella lonarensis]|uniref:DUF5082 domain-containing protein n=1 Tax=Shouchella lonarensis TaxID=1464122 RepID=A0A1G6HPW6_9BACI|nr:hypothetical protein [Shouchella lonarensis]SDB95895.1 hypothetical protein SAMN05421737_10499 [Shouchella lonarensis]
MNEDAMREELQHKAREVADLNKELAALGEKEGRLEEASRTLDKLLSDYEVNVMQQISMDPNHCRGHKADRFEEGMKDAYGGLKRQVEDKKRKIDEALRRVQSDMTLTSEKISLLQ